MKENQEHTNVDYLAIQILAIQTIWKPVASYSDCDYYFKLKLASLNKAL